MGLCRFSFSFKCIYSHRCVYLHMWLQPRFYNTSISQKKKSACKNSTYRIGIFYSAHILQKYWSGSYELIPCQQKMTERVEDIGEARCGVQGVCREGVEWQCPGWAIHHLFLEENVLLGLLRPETMLKPRCDNAMNKEGSEVRGNTKSGCYGE